MEYGTLDFSGDDFVRGAMLGLTVDTGLVTILGFWKNFTYFLRRTMARILAFLLLLNGRSMLSRCFDLNPCTRSSPLEHRHYFYELTSWIRVMMWGFFVLSAHFSDSPDMGRVPSCQLTLRGVDIRIPLKDRVKKNNNFHNT